MTSTQSLAAKGFGNGHGNLGERPQAGFRTGTRAGWLDGSMAERLDVFAEATRKLHPSTAAIVDRLVARLKQHDAGKDAPKSGDVMPSFVLPDETGRLVSL